MALQLPLYLPPSALMTVLVFASSTTALAVHKTRSTSTSQPPACVVSANQQTPGNWLGLTSRDHQQEAHFTANGTTHCRLADPWCVCNSAESKLETDVKCSEDGCCLPSGTGMLLRSSLASSQPASNPFLQRSRAGLFVCPRRDRAKPLPSLDLPTPRNRRQAIIMCFRQRPRSLTSARSRLQRHFRRPSSALCS